MKTKMQAPLFIFLCGFIGSACDPPEQRNCEVTNVFPSTNEYDLDFDLYLPSDCPVPIGSVGETKYVAGAIEDLGSQELWAGSVLLKNGNGDEKASSGLEIAHYNSQGHREVEVGTEYPAATAGIDSRDRAYFDAFALSDHLVFASATVYISYVETQVTTDVSGTEIPAKNSTATWYGSASGGTGPYQYNWYRGGAHVGTGSSYTANAGTETFDLRLEVTDATWSTVAAVHLVQPGGIRTSVSGPSTVYSSEGGGSWSAPTTGGTGSYSYTWYVDNNQVGSGPTWEGYTGQYHHDLTVYVTDSAGASHSATMTVYGIGNDQEEGGCQPTPPAITC